MARFLVAACLVCSAWSMEEEALSLLQKRSGFIFGKPVLPAEKIMRNETKLDLVAERMFKHSDVDENNAIDFKEAHRMFKKLADDGRIPRLPNRKEQQMLKALAGDDRVLQLDEFTQAVKSVAKFQLWGNHIVEAQLIETEVESEALSLIQTRSEVSSRKVVPAEAQERSESEARARARARVKIHRISKRMFTRFDTDGNNGLDHKEAHHMFQRLVHEGRLPHMPTQNQVKMLKTLAGDDRVLQLDEFEGAVMAVARAKAVAKADRIESDGSETLSEPTTEYGSTVSRATEMLFEKADKDSNGVVDKKEALSMFKRLVDLGKLPRLPTADEAKKLSTFAGDDQVMHLNEFEQLVVNVWRAARSE